MDEKTKECLYCKSDINIKASVCPYCNRYQLKYRNAIIIISSLIIIISCSIMFYSDDIFSLSVYGNNSSENISLAEYNSIKSGMSYKDVVKIIGSEGTVLSEVSLAGYNNVIVSWQGNGTIGANANITFSNGKVYAKAQIGLE